MSDRLIVGCVRVAAGLGLTTAVLGSAILLGSGHFEIFLVQSGASFAMPFAIFFSVLAWLTIPRQPRNAVVWVMVFSALCWGLYVAGIGLFTVAFPGDPGVLYTSDTLTPADLSPAAAWILTFTFLSWIPGLFSLTTLGLLLFPDGKLPSPRWRWVARVAVLSITAGTIGGSWTYRAGSTSPYNSDTFSDPLATALILTCCLTSVISLAALIGRFRRSDGETRQQFKWVVWGASFFIAAVLPAFFLEDGDYEGVSTVLFYVGGAALLASYGIAIAKYRLYDVDLVINQTLVFALLAGFITLVYAVFVVGVGEMVGGGHGLVLPVMATAVVAVAFEPVRQRAQRWANRVVYGLRATPYEVLSDLTPRLAVGEQGEGVLARMVGLLGDGTGAERATVWLGSPGEMRPAASRPEAVPVPKGVDLDAEGVYPVLHDGEVVGALEVVKPPGSALSRAESLLVSDVAGSSGLVLGYQRLNESLAQRAEEMEESRLRLLGAQDEERRRLERELHDGAQQLIVELENEATVASRLARRHQVADLALLLEGVAEEAGMALEEVRSLAKGIYPAVLESDGLAAAVSDVGEAAPVEVIVDDGGIGRYPPDVEAAVYFDISEAITNAVKHAHPPIVITLDDTDGILRFAVTDAGPGFDPLETEHGSGLENMADRMDSIGGRLEVVSTPGGATRVTGEVAVGATAEHAHTPSPGMVVM